METTITLIAILLISIIIGMQAPDEATSIVSGLMFWCSLITLIVRMFI